jgi:hypothetical protein
MGIGATTASKIMARKRSDLSPIWDEGIGTSYTPVARAAPVTA